jgi:branched-chain amino acid transport system substrate-binding protein
MPKSKASRGTLSRESRGTLSHASRGTLSRRASLALLALGAGNVLPRAVRAAGKTDVPGVTDTEIRIGQTIPYSGPASSLGTIGRAAAAYYKMVNDQGGVNGRQINFLSVDDGYSPPRTVEQVRRLVEQDGVLGMFGSLGTAQNLAVQRFLNDRKVPQFFIFSGVARFRDPRAAPWSMGGDLAFVNETKAFARYIQSEVAEPRIAVLYQNDDFGKDHLTGLRAGLGSRAEAAIVRTASFEVTDATVDSQIIQLQSSGANVLLTAGIPRFAAQAIHKMHEIGWQPLHVLGYPAASIPATFKPAGMEASVGIVTAEFVKQPGDPAWVSDPEMLAFLDFMKKYAPELDPNDKFSVFGYYHAAAVIKVLGVCGDDLTRENVLNKMTHLDHMTVPMLLPGITMSTTPEDYAAIKQMQLQRFDGTGWVKIGGVVLG